MMSKKEKSRKWKHSTNIYVYDLDSDSLINAMILFFIVFIQGSLEQKLKKQLSSQYLS